MYTGAATPEQVRSVARFCLDHDELFVNRGQVRHLPKGLFWGKSAPQWVPAQKLEPK